MNQTHLGHLAELIARHSGWGLPRARYAAAEILARYDRADGSGKWRVVPWTSAEGPSRRILSVDRENGLYGVWEAEDEAEAEAIAAALNELESDTGSTREE